MSFVQTLAKTQSLRIKQKRELAELFGFETRNKYEISTLDQQTLAYAAEQQKGALGFLFRQFLGHWRSFEIHVFDPQKTLTMVARHPFRFLFQRLEVYDANGTMQGALQQRFAILKKRFDVLDATGQVVMLVSSPIWKPWTFPFTANGQEVATIQKKWGGLLKEAITDSDNFVIEFKAQQLPVMHRALLIAAALFIDLQYFEKKAG